MGDTVDIVGAGPSGIAAAIVLRRHGIPVRVYERYPAAGYRLNGDFQGLENWSTKKDALALVREIGIDINFPCIPYYGGTIHAPSREPLTVSSERPIFYLVKRGAMAGSLDTGLREQAEALGVAFHFNHRVRDLDRASIVGTGPAGADAIAVGMTFTTGGNDRAAVVFSDDIAPAGYAYLLVHDGCGTMATVMYRHFHLRRECYERMVQFFLREYPMDIRNGNRFGGHAAFFLRDTQVRGKTLYIGESAGFQDFLWGFGMRYALLSGLLAGRSIIEGTDYDSLWKRELRPMLETSLVNRYLVETFGPTGYRYLARKLGEGDPCEFLRHHYNHTPWKHLLLPLAKLSLKNRIGIKEAAPRHSR
jgi:flavin-dependent dehydrogenase